MGIKFTADNFSTDFTAGGGVDATNWSKTFADYWQGSALHHYAHGSGSLAYTATQHFPFYYQFEVSPRSDPGSGSYEIKCKIWTHSTTLQDGYLPFPPNLVFILLLLTY